MLPWGGKPRASPTGFATPQCLGAWGWPCAHGGRVGISVPGCQPVPLPALCKQWPLTLPAPACTLVRVGEQAAVCTLLPTPSSLAPIRASGLLLMVGLEDRAAALPRGRWTVPELSQHVDGDSPQGRIGPEPEMCLEGRRDQAERGGVGFGRREATNLSFSKPSAPFPLYL